ncbi:aspartate/glutamate racemase family protein [Caproicibacter sp. BJN0012]|uniref:aspartate/glutamate racemase family protein n=1 Tax=Caproicibacter sp. BJN0012 TaxID=3110227 RepID=UPI002E1278D1
MEKLEGRQYGYIHPGNDDCFIRNIPNQQIAGYSVGILYIEHVNYPMMPGNVVNACTYHFPVRMMAVPHLTNTRLFEGDPAIADDIILAARHMVEKEGVRAICSACGFFGNYHKLVAEALDVPVAMSSLVQIPMIQAMLKPDQKIGILTANAASMTKKLFENCCVTRTDNLVVQDTRHTKHFANAVVDMAGYMDNGKARDEIVSLATELLKKDGSIGAILLECSDMPPYAADIQAATQLPVFDFITLIDWLHHATAQRPYSGWI